MEKDDGEGMAARGSAEAEALLGWRVFRPADAAARIISANSRREIISGEGNQRVYCLKGFPDLTGHEARLVRDVMAEFQEGQSEGGSGIVGKTLEKYCEKNLLQIDDDQRAYLLWVLNRLIFDFGAISELLKDDSIEEIAVIGLGEKKPVYVYERSFGWMKTNIYFSDETVVRNLVNKMSRKLGRRLTMQTPKLNAVLPDGSRLNACIEPVSTMGPAVTIRKFRQKPFTPVDLVGNRTISAEALAFLWMAMQADLSVLVCGNTGSGKTSTLNALFCFIPAGERIVVVEETPEINLPHEHVVKINTVENLGIDMDALITDSLRMRPDRVIVGEVRNRAEVSAFIDTMLAGQGHGSYATFHAQSAKEAIVRMEKLGVAEMDLCAIDLIIVQKRWNKADMKRNTQREVRRVVEIAEVCERNCTPELNCLYMFNHRKDSLQACGESTKVLERMMKTYGAGREALAREMKARARVARGLKAREMGIGEFFNYVNGERQ